MVSNGASSPRLLNKNPSITIVENHRSSSKIKSKSGNKPTLLPDLSASTQEILARIQAESSSCISTNTSNLTSNLNGSASVIDTSGNVLAPDPTADATVQFQRPRM